MTFARAVAVLVALTGAAACNCGGGMTPDGGTAGGAAGGSAGGTAGGGGAAGGTAGGGAAGGATAGGSGGGGTAGGSAGGGMDAGPNPLLPRLVVASRGATGVGTYSVRIWDTANTVSADVPANVVLGGIDAPAAALAVDGLNLYVVHETTSAGAPVLQRFVGVRTLDGGSPAVRITAATLGPVQQVNEVQLDTIGALWIQRSPGEVLRIDNVAAATPATGWSGRYTHPFDQISGFAFEQTNNRLFAAQVSGAGILVWNQANTEAGDAGPHDFVLATDTVQQLEISGGRLYASFFEREVKVWSSIGTAATPRAYAFALRADAGTNASIRDQAVFNDHLVVTVQATPSAGQVLIYKNIGITFTDRAPDLVIDHPSLGAVTKSVLGRDGTLYVLDLNGVTIFGDALTLPVFKTELTNGLSVPADLELLE